MVFPNPTNDFAVIRADLPLVGEEYKIYNELGQMVETGQIDSPQHLLDLSQFPSGLYVIEVTNVTQRVIKQ